MTRSDKADSNITLTNELPTDQSFLSSLMDCGINIAFYDEHFENAHPKIRDSFDSDSNAKNESDAQDEKQP
jgi:hypothetical protein